MIPPHIIPSGTSIAETTVPNVVCTTSPISLAVTSGLPESALRSPLDKQSSLNHFHKNYGIIPLSKQRSQTRTGWSPQPLSGTGLYFDEHSSQKPPPQDRQ